MGVLIIAGLATIVVTIVHRVSAGKPAERPVAERSREEQPLPLPAGSRIAGMAVGDGRLVLRLEGPGTEERLLIVELSTGRVLSTLRLEPAP